jgi:phosphoribosylglycinamide formyltransferase
VPPDAAPRRAVFVSGGGSNFKAVHAATVDGRINGRVVVRLQRLRKPEARP